MIRFKEAAEQIKQSGPKELTVRQLLALFGQQRRGRRVAAQIRRALKREKLETVPNFEVVRGKEGRSRGRCSLSHNRSP